MNSTSRINVAVILFTCLGVLYSFVSCKEVTTYPYPALLEGAIDLFFIENKNDTVLQLLEQASRETQHSSIHAVISVFQAGALSEIGKADSAALVLQNINTGILCPRGRYYYNSIEGLNALRLNRYQEAFRAISFLINGASLMNGAFHDKRCDALNERLLARLMIHHENYEIAIRLFYRSIQKFQEVKLDKSAAVNKKFLASIYSELGSYDEAMKMIEEAESVFIAHDDPAELYYLYIVAIKLCVDQERPEMAQRYVEKVMASTSISLDSQMLSSLYTYMGRIERLKESHFKAIRMFDRVIQIDDVFFGSERIKARAYIHLSSLYNELGEHEAAIHHANMALQTISEDGQHYLKHEAYKELSVGYLKTDPSKAYHYMESSLLSMQQYNKASSMGIVEFMNTRLQLEGTAGELILMQENQKRNRVLNYAIAAIILVIVIGLFVVNKMRKKINNTLSELVNKNLSQMKSEQKMSNLIKKQPEIEAYSENSPLTNEQKDLLLYNNFKEWLEKEKQYLRSDLHLNTVSRELGTNRSYLSKSINAQGTRFTELVNRYRVQEVLSIFEDEEDIRNSFTLQEIASEAGFHTKSVFFDAFRKETGMTPNQFKEYLKYSKIEK